MVAAIITAAGSGVRMGSKTRKQYLSLGGAPILTRTVQAFRQCGRIDEIILVVPAQDIKKCRRDVLRPFDLENAVQLVPGGGVRQESVFNGIRALNADCSIVLIHDGVRPFIDPLFILQCIEGAEKHGACILAVPASDTLKQTDGQGRITGTLDRSLVWLAQTPQAFKYDLIFEAHQNAALEGFTGTDDASLVERRGKPVHIIEGSRNNIKITTPDDLLMADSILKYF